MIRVTNVFGFSRLLIDSCDDQSSLKLLLSSDCYLLHVHNFRVSAAGGSHFYLRKIQLADCQRIFCVFRVVSQFEVFLLRIFHL